MTNIYMELKSGLVMHRKLATPRQATSIKLYKLAFLCMVLMLVNTVVAQNVGIGTIPDSSAKLEVKSTNSGFLMPRLSTAQRDAISSPATGLMIYNTDCNAFNYYNGNAWVPVTPTNSLASPVAIVGDTSPCQNATGITYYISSVLNATSYTWMAPAGTNITSGQGTTTITTHTGTTDGKLCVTATNACETSYPTCISLTYTAPPSVPTVTSASSVLPTQFTANWNAAARATSYYLDVATDSAFTAMVSGYSNLNVGNGTSYTVTGITCNTAYYYRIRSTSTCGTSSNSATISLVSGACCSGPPSTPGSINGNVVACGTTQSYGISAVSGATSYTWTVPSGTITGQGTDSISVSGISTGTISVTATNGCGTSSPSTLGVTILNGWQYSKAITISNSSGTALTDFQVKMTVSFVSGHMNVDFSDLRFYSSSGTALNYWIESYTASSSAVVWIKVPSIPTTGTTIYMYYGNSSATSTANAANVFVFYDDCSSTSGWTTINNSGSGTFTSTSGHLRLTYPGSCCSWKYITVEKTLSSALTTGAYVVSFKNRADKGNSGICAAGDFTIYSNGNGGDMYVRCDDQNYCSSTNNNNIELAGNQSGTGYYTNNVGSSFAQFDIKPMDLTNKTATLYKDGSSTVSVSGGSIAPDLTSIRLTSQSYSSYTDVEEFDDIIIRKYSNPDPSASFGSEQSCQ